MTKHLLRNSCGPQEVLCIKKTVICSSRNAYTNLVILRANFGCKTLQRLVVEQPNKVIIFYQVHLLSEQTYHPPCSTRAFFNGDNVTCTHSCMIFVFMAQFIPPNPAQLILFFFVTLCRSPLPFGKKRKEKVKVTLIAYFSDCLFTETSTVSAQGD